SAQFVVREGARRFDVAGTCPELASLAAARRDVRPDREAAGCLTAYGHCGSGLERDDRPLTALIDKYRPHDRHHPRAVEERMIRLAVLLGRPGRARRRCHQRLGW